MRQLRIVLPWPDARLNPNRSKGRGWKSDAAVRTSAQGFARMLTHGELSRSRATPPDYHEPLRLVYTFHPPDKRRRDLDNLTTAMKPARDGIALALGTDDRWFVECVQRWGDPDANGDGLVVVEVESLT